ncbi:MAG: endonuclease/exonuclease/phosphatase family protein [Candidatus Thiodiazotropha taylori]|nr:endonuclease/exonuclease/phosphatase family protein [Candidatus Thiodiazotropha taylori]
MYLSSFELMIILSLLLLKSGDVEPNPGPDSSDSSLSSSSSSFSSCNTILQEHFSVVHYNIQSLSNKVDILESELSKFDVVCLSETWLDHRTTDNDINMHGFNVPYRRDRQGDNHGGICVYVKENVYAKRRADLELQDIECLWIEVSSNRNKLLIGTFYRPPNSPPSTLESIENSIGLAYDTNIDKILITGDFNLDTLKSASSRKIETLCQYFNLHNLINEPTHFTESSSSIIDLILTSNKHGVLLSGVGEPCLEQAVRYHCPIFCVLDFKKPVTKVFSRQVWLYDRGEYDALREEISNFDWQSLKHQDIDTYTKNVTDYIINTSKKHIPNKIVKIRKSDPPWLSSKIKRMMRKRKKLYDKYKRTNNVNDHTNYKTFRNKVTNEIRQTKKLMNENLANKLLNSDLRPKDYWKTLKHFINKEQSFSIPPLKVDGIVVEEDLEKATALNDYFTEQTILDDTHASLPATPPADFHSLSSIVITPDEVQSVLQSLTIGKAAGPDSISNRLLKELAIPLSGPLCDLFNFSLHSGQVPSTWKEANVTPVHKKDDPSVISNYRPISLLNTVGKVMEKIVHKHVFNFCRDNSILTSLQSGFVPGDSTVNQLVDLYNTFCKALDEGKEVRAVFCDISKAFDRVWHRGLLYKLRRIGISGSLLSWFANYLKDRRQRVVLPGASSNWSSINAGVPQGSILGPLLFLIYINDIVENINSSIRLFADDTSLYIIVDDPTDAAITLNSDLYKIHKWATDWLVSFNPSKSESLIFSRKINKPYHPPIFMNNQQVEEVSTHKHLGLYLSNNCSWHEHIDYIKTKAWQRINTMRRLKFDLDRKSLQIIYFSFIRPLLEYADIVWNNCTQYESLGLEQIQYEAARIVTGATRLVSINSLLNETGWETLSSRRKNHKLVMFYKMQNNLCPVYLSSLVPRTVGSSVSYSLRNADDIQTVNTNTQLYYTSFLPSVIREWNDLPGEIQNANSIAAFKYNLKRLSNISSPPPYYSAGNRTCQIHHTRIRTNCSSLNQHLFSKHIILDPHCACGEVEDSRHFLLECNLYQNIRNDMLTAVSRICLPTLNSLLYGSTAVSVNDNIMIFKAVQTFILKSKRFHQ